MKTKSLINIHCLLFICLFSWYCNGTTYDEPIEANCHRCHGDKESPAPPCDTSGRTSTDFITVGAHREHLRDSTWHAKISCSQCHVVPKNLFDEGHLDSSPYAEVVFGDLARNRGANPQFNRNGQTGTCYGGYCHGAVLLPGGEHPELIWNKVDGSAARCGTCHGLPPQSPHPDSDACSICHGNVVTADRTFIAPDKHINGEVDMQFQQTCNACHGSSLNPAPPPDTTGNSDPSSLTVGLHQIHLASSNWHRQYNCSQCHIVPDNIMDSGHMDDPPAEVVFGDIAGADDASPIFSYTDGTCSGVYCHGATMPDSSTWKLGWTSTGNGESKCGACHGLPPSAPHPDDARCHFCHMGVVSESGFVNPSLHINGEINFNQ